MKKTILLASLIAMTAMASTTGNVEFFNENKLETTPTIKFTTEKLGVKTEVKVKDSGLSFGGEFKVKDLEIPLTKAVHENLVNNSSVFVKYELPEIKTVNSYVKATVKPNTKNEDFALELEADANTKYNNLKIGVNTKTDLKVGKLENTTSTHKLYVEGEYAPVKDIKAEVEVKHSYVKNNTVKYVSGKVEATYDKVKDLKLTGKVNFKVNVADKGIEVKRSDIKLTKDNNEARYVHSYDLIATYTGVKNLTLEANPFVAHVGFTDKNTAIYGVAAKLAYKMLDEKLTLTGKTLLSGATVVNTKVQTWGHFMFDANAKYDHKVTDKFTVSPEFDAIVTIDTKENNNKVVVDKAELTLTPKVSAEYKPIESLEIKGNVAVPVKFSTTKAPFNYETTTLKTSLNVKYTW